MSRPVREQSRKAILFVGLSLLVHVLLMVLAPAPTPDVELGRRFRVRPWSRLGIRQPYVAAAPDMPGRRLKRLSSPDLFVTDAATDMLSRTFRPTRGGIPVPRLSAADSSDLVSGKVARETPRVTMPDLNEMLIDGTRAVADEREQYARLYLPDADTTSSKSERRRRVSIPAQADH